MIGHQHSEELVALFNDEVGGKPEDKIDLEAFRKGSGKAAAQQISNLVNMAKADTLDAMGEDEAATELAMRHLEV